MTQLHDRLIPCTILFVAICSGCGTATVVPNAVHIPLMEKQWAVQLQATTGSTGATGSVAFSPLQNIAIKGSYSKAMSREYRDAKGILTDNTHGHELTEGALGYYLPSLPISGTELCLELYGGLTRGALRGGISRSSLPKVFQILDARAKQIFLELNAGTKQRSEIVFNNKDTLSLTSEYGTSFRLSKWLVTDIAYDGILAPAEKQEGNYFQITMFGRWPGRIVFLEVQAGMQFSISNYPNQPNSASLFLSMGLHLNLFQ